MDIHVFVITDHKEKIVVPQVFLNENDALIYLQIVRSNIVARENLWKITRIDICRIYESIHKL